MIYRDGRRLKEHIILNKMSSTKSSPAVDYQKQSEMSNKPRYTNNNDNNLTIDDDDDADMLLLDRYNSMLNKYSSSEASTKNVKVTRAENDISPSKSNEEKSPSQRYFEEARRKYLSKLASSCPPKVTTSKITTESSTKTSESHLRPNSMAYMGKSTSPSSTGIMRRSLNYNQDSQPELFHLTTKTEMPSDIASFINMVFYLKILFSL